MFSVLHKRLNQHFADINDRARTTNHYWADNSPDLISLFDTINEDLYELKRASVEIELIPAYQEAIDRCEPWLSQSGGSRRTRRDTVRRSVQACSGAVWRPPTCRTWSHDTASRWPGVCDCLRARDPETEERVRRGTIFPQAGRYI